jgi:hypothetical protein
MLHFMFLLYIHNAAGHLQNLRPVFCVAVLKLVFLLLSDLVLFLKVFQL